MKIRSDFVSNSSSSSFILHRSDKDIFENEKVSYRKCSISNFVSLVLPDLGRNNPEIQYLSDDEEYAKYMLTSYEEYRNDLKNNKVKLPPSFKDIADEILQCNLTIRKLYSQRASDKETRVIFDNIDDLYMILEQKCCNILRNSKIFKDDLIRSDYLWEENQGGGNICNNIREEMLKRNIFGRSIHD